MFVILSINVSAKTTLYYPLIDNLFETDKTGIYDQVVNEAIKRSNLEFNEVREPFARALGSFAADIDSCMSIGNKETAMIYLGIEAIDPGFGYYETKFMVATLKTKPVISDLKSLAGKKVGHLIGDDPSELGLADLGIKFEAVPSHESNYKKLSINRIDAILGADTDMVAFLKEIHYDTNAIIFKSAENIVCHANAQLEDTVNKFAIAIQSMIDDGTLEKMLKAFDN
ncbi:MAG: transporter substrate-binding domain-containing protein [Saccharospirillaceae bacterium]|nr:transporter substrate-binding domain-containing protein [Saccharospirillaceae bacterium]